MTHHRVSVKVAGLQPVQVLAALAGIAFIVFGVVGFTRTGFGDFASHNHAFVLGFSVNPLHNLVHVVIGVLGLLMALGSGLARLYGWLLFLGYGAVFVWGLMITGVVSNNPVSQAGNPLALNTNDNWLHFGLALFGLLLAVMPARRKLIEEEPEDVHDLPEQKDRRVEQMDPTVSTASREPITKEQAVVDPKTDKLDRNEVKAAKAEADAKDKIRH